MSISKVSIGSSSKNNVFYAASRTVRNKWAKSMRVYFEGGHSAYYFT